MRSIRAITSPTKPRRTPSGLTKTRVRSLLTRAFYWVQERGYFVVGLDGESEELISNMKVATEPIMIIVGSEGKGLHKLTREKCDLVVKIPMRSTTESLNASVATSIALYAVDEARK